MDQETEISIKYNTQIILIIKTIIIIIYFSVFFLDYKGPKNPFLRKENKYLIKEYKKYLEGFLNLREKPLNLNDPLLLEEKENIFNFISTTISKNVSSLKRIIFTTGANFGNILLCLNKLIFFCEIIGCTQISLQNKAFWFIKNSVFLKDFNITIDSFNDTLNNDSEKKLTTNPDTIYYDSFNVFFYSYKIKPKIRINFLKDEIISNLPKTNVSREDLYIHIRSGDIFTSYIHEPYSQPPLCFYTSIFSDNIFKNFNFSKIFLLSTDKNNPTIDKLLSKFKNIIYSQNSLEFDLSYLINSYNLVGSISSFLNTIIMLNSNLENLWEYNIYQMEEKILQCHYDLFEFPHSFTIYRMESSSYYKNKMYKWKNSHIQRKLMIKEKCINSFMIVNKGY